MRKFFNSKENYSKQQVKNCLYQKHKRHIQREKILRGLKSEIDRISAASKLAEAFAAQIGGKTM